MKKLKGILAMLAMLCAGYALSGCEGRAERAGEKIDRSVERAGDKIEDATDRK
jgi:hypothetical protein